MDPQARTPPGSRDPIYPGVLVKVSELGEEGYPPLTPVLKIGTVSQTRNPVIASDEKGENIELATDGMGIGMWVTWADESGFGGVWQEYGIVYDGRGTFCATRLPGQAAP